MTQQPENLKLQQPDANSTLQAHSFTSQNLMQGNQNRGVQGEANKAVQGDKLLRS
ncbi:hypothetical protein [Nodularia sp. NIES-3585]|uniref:hypothetical protein n=1 Tax=Nodularia sp. NIES-3585 TaxID=1973477 RepID=UPI000B659868|nr:hypothetical protein [Nodularia sp. NIES-3585]GAX38854.1 hypothetical protein NIES3585_49060 [Nodularia sp. NIES-3585]